MCIPKQTSHVRTIEVVNNYLDANMAPVHKITVLGMIRESKDILFGKFTSKLTKSDKVAEWKKITDTCQALGLVPTNKDYGYVRDTFWPNLKKTTVVSACHVLYRISICKKYQFY